MAIEIQRLENYFHPDPKRVILRFFTPGGEARARKIITRVLAMPEADLSIVLSQTLRDFSNRHRNITKVFLQHFESVVFLTDLLGIEQTDLTQEQRLVIGAYFTHEYAIESASFFNPSMVEAPDQSNLGHDQKRVVISFRTQGENHVSSIGFREAILDKNNTLVFSPVEKLVDVPETIRAITYKKKDFVQKLTDMKIEQFKAMHSVMEGLADMFTYSALLKSSNDFENNSELTLEDSKALRAINFIANAHYELAFSLDTAISERVIFPINDSESSGLEDARFVKFTEENGAITYYATCTTQNGFEMLPQLIATTDFCNFKITPIYGKCTQHKGLALFPRKVNNKYVMLSCHDGENNYVISSTDLTNWASEPQLIQEPEYSWEFVQLGNSGAPIETKAGWLLITHGVGAVRKSVLGAILLDINDPTKVLAKLDGPLLMANESEREGVVPNVVYSCGCMAHNQEIIIPFTSSDTSSGFAHVPLDHILDRLVYADGRPRASPQNHDKRILLVEDDLIASSVLNRILAEEGFKVVHVTDGLQALAEIAKHTFDLILSDIEMPNLNGYELLEYMNEKSIRIPVVFLSAYCSLEDEIKGLELGAMEYIRKPIRREVLRLRLNKILF